MGGFQGHGPRGAGPRWVPRSPVMHGPRVSVRVPQPGLAAEMCRSWGTEHPADPGGDAARAWFKGIPPESALPEQPEALRSLRLGPVGHKWDPLCSGSALPLFELGLSFTKFIAYMAFLFSLIH